MRKNTMIFWITLIVVIDLYLLGLIYLFDEIVTTQTEGSINELHYVEE